MTKSVKRKSARLVSRNYARSLVKRDIQTLGLSQSAYAKKIGEHPEVVSLVLSGKRNLSKTLLRRVKARRVIAYELR